MNKIFKSLKTNIKAPTTLKISVTYKLNSKEIFIRDLIE